MKFEIIQTAMSIPKPEPTVKLYFICGSIGEARVMGKIGDSESCLISFYPDGKILRNGGISSSLGFQLDRAHRIKTAEE